MHVEALAQVQRAFGGQGRRLNLTDLYAQFLQPKRPAPR